MFISLDNTLNQISSYIPSVLISNEAFSNIKETVRILPAATTSYFGFECRLNNSLPVADFALSSSASNENRGILAGLHPQINLPQEILNIDEWYKIQQFCKLWSSPTSILNKRIINVWLEFDIDGKPNGVPIPSLFIGLADTDNGDQWLITTVNNLLKHSLSFSEEKKILECIYSLPTTANLFQAGIMLSRQSKALRLCITNRGFFFSKYSFQNYLNTIEWPGSFNELYNLISKLSNFVDKILLGVDASNSISPKLSLECYIRKPPVTDKWKAFFEELVNIGLCTSNKRDGFITWAGRTREFFPHYTQSVTLFRQIHHVKIIYHADYPLQAKGYLLCALFPNE